MRVTTPRPMAKAANTTVHSSTVVPGRGIVVKKSSKITAATMAEMASTISRFRRDSNDIHINHYIFKRSMTALLPNVIAMIPITKMAKRTALR